MADDDEEDDDYSIGKDVRTKAKRDEKAGLHVNLGPLEIVEMIDTADKALNGDSNDDEHDALVEIRQYLSNILKNGTME